MPHSGSIGAKAESASDSRLRRIELTLVPEQRFPVPFSDGYSVYSALLGALHNVDEVVSAELHDSSLGSLHNSGLIGPFGTSDRRHHKMVMPNHEYHMTLGVVDPADAEIFQALVEAFVLNGDSIELTNGALQVQQFESENASHKEILEGTASTDVSGVTVDFRTPACIEEADEVTTMFPYRVAVFQSLLGKWNRTCPDELELELDRETLLTQVIEKPDARTYDTHSVLVNRVTNEEGENRNIFRQGFTGTCEYAFKGASEAVKNAVLGLAVFGEYSGVGSAVARGCGSVTLAVKINE